jgi:hypothetical protein
MPYDPGRCFGAYCLAGLQGPLCCSAPLHGWPGAILGALGGATVELMAGLASWALVVAAHTAVRRPPRASRRCHVRPGAGLHRRCEPFTGSSGAHPAAHRCGAEPHGNDLPAPR